MARASGAPAQLRRRRAPRHRRPGRDVGGTALRRRGLYRRTPRARALCAAGPAQPPLAGRPARRARHRRRARLRDQRRARRAALRARGGRGLCRARQPAHRALRQPLGLRALPALERGCRRSQPLVRGRQPGRRIRRTDGAGRPAARPRAELHGCRRRDAPRDAPPGGETAPLVGAFGSASATQTSSYQFTPCASACTRAWPSPSS